MKGKRWLLVGLMLGLLLGWVLGYLRVPYVESTYAFWIGSGVTAALLVATIGVVAIVRNIRAGRSDLRKRTGAWAIVNAVVLVGTLTMAAIFYHNSAQVAEANKRLSHENDLLSVQLKELGSSDQQVVGDLVEMLRTEAVDSSRWRGSSIDATIALCAGVEPHRLLKDADDSAATALSPERGKLLSLIVWMPVDSASLAQVVQQADFSFADLRGATLHDKDLRGINLQGANLHDVDLTNCNLAGANLTDARLDGAILNGANLSNAKLVRANLQWAELKNAVLEQANLDGVNLSNAVASKTNFQGATVQYATLHATVLNEANLQDINFLRTDFTKANLTSANLSESSLRFTDLSEVNLTNAKLDGTAVTEQNWLEKLSDWQIEGAENVRQRFAVIENDTDRWTRVKYCLTPASQQLPKAARPVPLASPN